MKIIKTTDYKTFCQMVGANLRFSRNKKILTQKSVGERIDITHQQVQNMKLAFLVAALTGWTKWQRYMKCQLVNC